MKLFLWRAKSRAKTQRREEKPQSKTLPTAALMERRHLARGLAGILPGPDVREYAGTDACAPATKISALGTMFRIGIGNDVHRLVGGRPLILGGLRIEHERGAEGHSDGDALTHALTDAILGALCEGDLGQHFPDSDPQWKNADSIELLARVAWLARERGYEIANADAVINLERPKLHDHIEAMRDKLAQTLNVEVGCVSVKAKTGEGLDAVGRGDAVSAQAVVLLKQISG